MCPFAAASLGLTVPALIKVIKRWAAYISLTHSLSLAIRVQPVALCCFHALNRIYYHWDVDLDVQLYLFQNMLAFRSSTAASCMLNAS